MKKKIIWPVIMIVWIVGIACIWYSLCAVEAMIVTDPIQMQRLVQIKGDILYKGISVITVGSIAIYFILNRIIKEISKPIQELTEEARSFGEGEYKHNVRHYSVQEIEHLAHAFDNMGENFYRTIRKLHYQKTKAESILLHLDQGFIIMDQEGYVSEMNRYAEKMLKIEGAKISHYHIKDVLRESKCLEMLDRVLTKEAKVSWEITMDSNIYYMKVRPIQDNNTQFGFIVSIQDITNIRKLEEMRYQFVSNVTHEIKTPLTSIQGFVETLKDGAIENPTTAKRFLDIIDIEAKRLYRLIQDILLLSEIESMDNICNEDTKVDEVIDEIINLLVGEAKKKDIEIVYDEKSKIILANTNRDHVKQTLLNLVSNAIRYTDSGKIIIYTELINNKAIIKVKDTGIGIPKDSIDRIFERFYRVDKSRSRKSGGTGLGLSIVKHMVELYKGKISVESEVGKGSIFTIELPIQ